jgi:hypothetical protein
VGIVNRSPLITVKPLPVVRAREKESQRRGHCRSLPGACARLSPVVS